MLYSQSSSSLYFAGPNFDRKAAKKLGNKLNPFNENTREAVIQKITNDEFQPLAQMIMPLIVLSGRKVFFEPISSAFSLLKDLSGATAIREKIKKFAEIKGRKRTKHILPSISLDEKPAKDLETVS